MNYFEHYVVVVVITWIIIIGFAFFSDNEVSRIAINKSKYMLQDNNNNKLSMYESFKRTTCSLIIDICILCVHKNILGSVLWLAEFWLFHVQTLESR